MVFHALAVRVHDEGGEVLHVADLVLRPEPDLVQGIPADAAGDGGRLEAQHLLFADAEFDAAGLCVSIGYLTDPVAVLREPARVLRPGAPLVVTFSNRCFPTKAVAVWHALDDAGRCALVAAMFRAAGEAAWEPAEVVDRSPPTGGDPLYAVIARRRGGGAITEFPEPV